PRGGRSPQQAPLTPKERENRYVRSRVEMSRELFVNQMARPFEKKHPEDPSNRGQPVANDGLKRRPKGSGRNSSRSLGRAGGWRASPCSPAFRSQLLPGRNQRVASV